MVCCAFAVLVLLPLLIPLRRIWKRVTGRDASANRAVEWSLHSPVAVAAPRPGFATPQAIVHGHSKRLAATVLGIGIVVAIGAASVRSEPATASDRPGWSSEQTWYDELHVAWCGAFESAAE
jgi:hypothetical protein